MEHTITLNETEIDDILNAYETVFGEYGKGDNEHVYDKIKELVE